MALFFFYKNRKPRKFNYQPILFNPEKEEREERLKKRTYQIKKEMGVLSQDEIVDERVDLKAEFLAQTKHLKSRKELEEKGGGLLRTRNGQLLVILLILLMLFFILYK